MSSKGTSEYRRRRKQNLMLVCGNKCAICGYDKSVRSLEFHHLDPKEKKFSIAASGTCRDLETDIAEIRKCILVCSNCHGEIHDDKYSMEELKSLQHIDEDVIKRLRKEKQQLMEKTRYYCKSCGTEITRFSQSHLCTACSQKAQRTVERPSREELKDLIRKMPFTQIGQKFGVTDNAIRKWCKAENLPTKKTDINKMTDQQWEKV